MNDLQQKQAAIDCAKRALKACKQAESTVKSARMCGVFDIFSASGSFMGGILSMMKHSELRRAKRDIEVMKAEMSKFHSKYFSVASNSEVKFGTMDMVADLFIDNIFVDGFYQIKIEKFLKKIRENIVFLEDFIEYMKNS